MEDGERGTKGVEGERKREEDSRTRRRMEREEGMERLMERVKRVVVEQLEGFKRDQQLFLSELKSEWEKQRSEMQQESERVVGEMRDREKKMIKRIEQLRAELKTQLEVAGEEGQQRERTWRKGPRGLSEEEWEEERRKREMKQRNIKVLGVKIEESEVMDIIGTLAAKTGIIPKVESSERRQGEVIIKLRRIENKIDIMSMRGNLKGTGIWIEDDWTEREEEINEWLKKEKKRMEGEGKQMKIKYMKAKVGETVWKWSEQRGEMIVSGIEEEQEKKEERRDE